MKKISLLATSMFLVSFSHANSGAIKGSFLMKSSYILTSTSVVDNKIKKMSKNKSSNKSIISAMFNGVDSLKLSKKSIVLSKQ